MTYSERNTIAHLISTLVVISGFFIYMLRLVPLEGVSDAEALMILGRAFLVMVGAGIVVTILATILVTIVATAVMHARAEITQEAPDEKEPAFITDERDDQIELRGMRWGTYLLGVGMVGSMALLAFGQPAFAVFLAIILAGALADIIASVLSLYWHRRGF